jgi:hypothetical protein
MDSFKKHTSPAQASEIIGCQSFRSGGKFGKLVEVLRPLYAKSNFWTTLLTPTVGLLRWHSSTSRSSLAECRRESCKCQAALFIEQSVQLFHQLTLFSGPDTWFEQVPSEHKWSDGLSRNGPTDQWIVARGVPCSSTRAPLAAWQRTLAEFWQGWSDGNPLEAFREYIGS